MRRFDPDPVLTWAARIAALLWGALATVELAYVVFSALSRIESAYYWQPALPRLSLFAVGALSALGLARLARAGRLTAVRLMACVAGLLVGHLAAGAFFNGTMHDVALIFDSHGRWGCARLAADGSEYWLRSGTAELLLFGPPVVTLVWRGVCRLRRLT